MTPRTNRTLSLAAAVVAGALIGAGGGAATYAVLKPAGSKTVVRQVTVADSQPASTGSALSVSSIYQLARKGVVNALGLLQADDVRLPLGEPRGQVVQSLLYRIYVPSGNAHGEDWRVGRRGFNWT